MLVIEDMVLSCWVGSASELSRGGAECCCGSLPPPAGARALSGGDSGGQWSAGVWRA